MKVELIESSPDFNIRCRERDSRIALIFDLSLKRDGGDCVNLIKSLQLSEPQLVICKMAKVVNISTLPYHTLKG